MRARAEPGMAIRSCSVRAVAQHDLRLLVPLARGQRLPHRRLVKLVGVCLLLAGCFQWDPLNSAPSARLTCEFVDGRSCGSDSDVHRGGGIRLHVFASDPDEDELTNSWQASACIADNGTGCIYEPFDMQIYDERRGTGTELTIPLILPGDARSISVDFETLDGRGGGDPSTMVFHLIDAPAHEPRSVESRP